MKYKLPNGIVSVLTIFLFVSISTSYAKDGPKLHVNDRWKECSMQLDPSLTQDAWHQFTQEAGIMTVFNPLTSAQPLGKWNFDIGLSMGYYPIEDEDAAWNDTFVHSDSTHWLYGKDGEPYPDDAKFLSLPLILVRLGITDQIDVGFYYFSVPEANYGFRGGQLQYNFLNDEEKNLSAAARVSIGQLFKVEDLDLSAYSVDVVATKDLSRFTRFEGVSGYAGLTGYLVSTHEKTSAVDLDDENVFGIQGNAGVSALFFSHLRIGVQLTVGALIYPSFVIGFAR
ncbi:MAG: hypothetical protein V3U21_05965 [Thermodesulfobacteriota bacterium]